MAPINTRTVRRTHALLQSRDSAYGKKFVYNEKAIAQSETQAKIMAKPAPPPEILLRLISEGKLPKPGEGPSEEQRKKNSFKMTFIGESEDGKKMITWISGQDGYEVTAVCAVEAALSVLELQITGNKPVGVLTPAVAFGERLIGRLQSAGINFGENPSESKL